MTTKTNFEMLIWGVQHIAKNHGFEAHTEDWEIDGEVYICGNNVPTLADVKMLCEDLGIPQDFIECGYGIDIFIPQEWLDEKKDIAFNGEFGWLVL